MHQIRDMRQRMAASIFAASVSILEIGCATRQQTGAVAGAGIGAATGAAVTDSAVGALVGGVIGAAIGSEIGRALDQYDRERAARILEYNETYEATSWVNPDTGYLYRVTPTDTYVRRGAPCREFRMDARIDGDWEEVHGTACRQPDGSWRIES